MKKQTLWTIVIIIAVVVLAYFIITGSESKTPQTDEEAAKCIGQNSLLYVQLGCPHCKDQEEMFGDNVKYLNTIDCFYEGDKCADITGTPTWVINGKKYVGVQDIETLKQLTGC